MMPNRIITINIRNYLVTQPRNKRTRKAVRYIRERVAHYTKTQEDNVKISKELNERIFKYYSKNMRPVKMTVSIDAGKATATPFSEQKAEQKVEQKQESKTSEKKQEQKLAAQKVSQKTEQKKST
jgi:ribosomal protein L31E